MLCDDKNHCYNQLLEKHMKRVFSKSSLSSVFFSFINEAHFEHKTSNKSLSASYDSASDNYPWYVSWKPAIGLLATMINSHFKLFVLSFSHIKPKNKYFCSERVKTCAKVLAVRNKWTQFSELNKLLRYSFASIVVIRTLPFSKCCYITRICWIILAQSLSLYT